MRLIYSEIITKPINHLAYIVSNESSVNTENFIYKNLISCILELSKRLVNLKKLKDENLINDWFVSLFNHRMAHFAINICDQSRIGISESRKGVGETDGLIIDRNNNSIGMIEAMILNSIDKTIINKHLDKIATYDQECISPIFIISYCYFENFASKTNKYVEHLKAKQYFSFNKINNNNHSTEILENSERIFSLLEYRNRVGKKIAIYHVLLNMSIDI